MFISILSERKQGCQEKKTFKANLSLKLDQEMGKKFVHTLVNNCWLKNYDIIGRIKKDDRFVDSL
jgi:hypothetical protein